MSKKVETKKANDPVGEYLVKRIAELEESLKETIKQNLSLNIKINELEEKAKKFEEIKKLFTLEHGVICLYNTKSEFESAVATTVNDFGNYLIELLDLKEKE